MQSKELSHQPPQIEHQGKRYTLNPSAHLSAILGPEYLHKHESGGIDTELKFYPKLSMENRKDIDRSSATERDIAFFYSPFSNVHSLRRRVYSPAVDVAMTSVQKNESVTTPYRIDSVVPGDWKNQIVEFTLKYLPRHVTIEYGASGTFQKLSFRLTDSPVELRQKADAALFGLSFDAVIKDLCTIFRFLGAFPFPKNLPTGIDSGTHSSSEAQAMLSTYGEAVARLIAGKLRKDTPIPKALVTALLAHVLHKLVENSQLSTITNKNHSLAAEQLISEIEFCARLLLHNYYQRIIEKGDVAVELLHRKHTGKFVLAQLVKDDVTGRPATLSRDLVVQDSSEAVSIMNEAHVRIKTLAVAHGYNRDPLISYAIELQFMQETATVTLPAKLNVWDLIQKIDSSNPRHWEAVTKTIRTD